MTIRAEIQSLSPSALIDLFVIDLTPHGGNVEYFHDGTNGVQENIIWAGIEYRRMPIEVTGFAKRGEGALPRPILRVSNQAGAMASVARQYGGFLRCTFIRRRTMAKYLDAINFPGGVNPTADPNQAMPEEIWYIARKARENPELLEFEMAAATDMQDAFIPAGQFIASSCNAGYRSSECSYAGGPVADEFDVPTDDPNIDNCSRKLSGCKLRHGEFGILPFAGFPMVGRLR